MPRYLRPARETRILAAILIAGLVVRLVAAPLTQGNRFDLHIMGQWSYHLRYSPLSQFYARSETPDHLPGDLWLFWLLSRVFTFFGGSHLWGDTYYFMIKVVPSLADIAIAALLFAIVRSLRGPRQGLVAAALVALNPGIIFVSGFWGQWDAVSMAFLLGGLAVILLRPQRWLLAVPLIAWATVIKPPLVLPALFILAWPLVRDLRTAPSLRTGLNRACLGAVSGVVIGLVTITLLTRPFDVGLPGTGARWSIFERARFALDVYPYKTLAATNLWMLPQGSFAQIGDTDPVIGSLSAHDLGNLLLAIACIAVALTVAGYWWRARRTDPVDVLAWGGLMISWATYMLPTRVHERYLFPAIVFAILLVGLRGASWRGIAYIVIMSLVFLGSLVTVYYSFHEIFVARYGDNAFAILLRGLSIANVLLFIGTAAFPPMAWRNTPADQRRWRGTAAFRREADGRLA